MTEAELRRVVREKYYTPRSIRKSKLKMRFKGVRLGREIERTREKLALLLEIENGR